MRIAAGVCALSIGLLVGSSGGAVALADGNESGGASAGTQGTGGAGSQNTTSTNGPTAGNQPTSTPTAGPTGTNPTGTPSDQTDRPTSTVSAQTNTSDDDEEGSGSTANGDADENATPSTESNAPASATNTPAPESNVAPTGSTTPASNTGPPAASTPTPPAPAAPTSPSISTNVVAPVTTAVVSVARALGTFPGTLASLPTSETPINDVITSMQEMLSSVAGAGAALAQASNDLYTLLGASANAQPSLIGGGGALDAAALAGGSGPLIGANGTQLPAVTPALDGNGSLFGTVVAASNVGGGAAAGLSQELSLSGLAPPLTQGVNPADAKSILDHVASAMLVPASLTALAAIAIPGIGGLLIVCAAGIRVGYRQAKAGIALRASGIARFAGPGPLGVVRSGSLISLHSRGSRAERPRPTHAARTKAAPAARHLEKVA